MPQHAVSHRIATLIANPNEPCLTADLIERVRTAIFGQDATILATGIACDIAIDDSVTRDAVRSALGDAPVDIVIQPAANRRKRLLIADMDSTMIEQECLDELAAVAGSGASVAAITARAMAGEIAFEPALRERVATLAGKSANLIDTVLQNRITHMPGGTALVATMRANGAFCALVSGGFTQFTSAVAGALGFDAHRANTFAIEDGLFTGGVVDPILGRDAKVEALDAFCAEQGLSRSDALAVGDGANDLGMLLAAGTGVALHAKPVVAQSAPHRIDHGDLTALLYMQGYRQIDFAG